jgi:hypothetical protein
VGFGRISGGTQLEILLLVEGLRIGCRESWRTMMKIDLKVKNATTITFPIS